MAGGKLSFKIAVSLATDGFDRGKRAVQAGFRSMRMSFMAFAAAIGAGGIGLTNFISKLVDVARESNSVQTALKNVSGSLRQYGENQKFLIDLSKKYGVNINDLTGAYAKFTAAANVANMPLEDQRKIFESVSRATVAFGMNAQDANGVFLALSQMMSKGKISSEELRLQMGERLPIAIQAMAKAAGVSVGELEDLMKKGKLLSSDVLPKFAQALDEMIPTVDTDNINTSLNRLQNKITEISEKLDISGKYKTVVDAATSILDAGLKRLDSFTSVLWGGIVSGSLAVINKIRKNWAAYYDARIHGAERVEQQALRATERRAAAEQAVRDQELALVEAQEAQKEALTKGTAQQQEAAARRVGQAKAALNKKMLALERARAAEETALAKKTALGMEAQALKGARGVTRALNIVKLQFVRAMVAIKAALVSLGWTALLVALGSAVAYVHNLYTEAKRLKNLVSDFNKEMNAARNTDEVSNLKKYQEIANNESLSYEARQEALNEINKIIGKNYKFEKDSLKLSEETNGTIKKRIELLALEAQLAAAQAKRKEAIEAKEEYISKHPYREIKDISGLRGQNRYLASGENERNAEKNAEIDKTIAEKYDPAIKLADRTIEDVLQKTARIKSLLPEEPKVETEPVVTTDPKQSEELQKQQKQYSQALAALNLDLERGWKTQSEYNKAVDDLTRNALRTALTSGDNEVLGSDYLKQLEAAAKTPLYDARNEEIERIERQYAEEMGTLNRQLNNGAISQAEYTQVLDRLSAELIKKLGGLLTEDEAQANLTYAMAQASADLQRPGAPQLEQRDTTFDYRKEPLEILQEEYDVARNNAEKLQAAFADGATELEEALAEAMVKAGDLGEKLKIATIKKDVKDLKKEFNDNLFSTIKGGVSNVNNVVSAFRNLNETLRDTDASGWEKIMAIWDGMAEVATSFMSVIQMINDMRELTDKLRKAKEAEGLVEKTNTAEEISGALAGAAAETTASGIKAAANAKEVAGNTAAAASGAAKSVAGIPIVGVAMAVAAVSAIMALMASLPKFANGGIVSGGPAVGDKILGRLNAGEMILNKPQQGSLYNLINGGGAARNISVSGRFEIEGRKLVALVDKENAFKKRTR